MHSDSHEVTRLLQEWSEGREGAFQELYERLHPELRQLAERHFRRERPGGTLQPTALVNEAYIRLLGQKTGTWSSRLQFFKLASQIMRHVMVDYFRSGKAQKRGGGVPNVTLDEGVAPGHEPEFDLIRLDDALGALKTINPLQSQIVELRFFGGMTVDEVAEQLGLNRAQVKRDWAAARDWLYDEMSVGT